MVVPKSVSKSCFYHIRSLRHIHSSLDDDMAGSVASAIVSSRLDYVSSILLGCPQKHIACLQRAQNALTRAVVQPQSRALPLSSSSHLFKQLYWLPIDWGYVLNCLLSPLKLCKFAYRSPDLLHLHRVYALSLHSTINTSTSQPFLGSRAFRISAPKKIGTLYHLKFASHTPCPHLVPFKGILFQISLSV